MSIEPQFQNSLGRNLSIRGEQIPRLYQWYSAHQLVVNRRYQRKLVWDVVEKRRFIDSLINGYPVPLILLAEKGAGPNLYFEILDGMQRLDAIMSFIEGAFSLENGEYFDLNTMIETKALLDQQDLKQRLPVLSRARCQAFAGYTLALSIVPQVNDSEIEEIFRRINASGRILSSQDLRTAGATGSFATIVRELSSFARGDVSYGTTLDLSVMRQISLTNRELDYGIIIDDTFWVKNSILTKDGVRRSRDEETIADLVANMVLTEFQSSQKEVFDSYYGMQGEPNDDRFRALELAISAKTPEAVKTEFIFVYDTLRDICDLSQTPLDRLMFGEHRPNGITRYFRLSF